MALQVYNTSTRQLEPFETLEENVVTMYVCGPTVYDKAHIGHAMSAITFDVIRRYLEHRGYRVIHAMNFTDVDDKIIQRANAADVDPLDLAQQYIVEWFEHVQGLNLLPAHHAPRVSHVMDQVIDMVQALIDKGYAYVVEGDVYFRVREFEDYGAFSGHSLDEAMSGSRVAVDARKESPLDFALWKAAKPGEPYWEAPWGQGRPGWHIECSAMSLHYLGEQIDIHGGGTDLIFPHHQNEIAQSEAYTGKKPFARYWLHNGMLQLRGEKMSKSLGNLVSIDQFLAEHEGDVLRLIVISSHYNKPLGYDDEVVANAEQGLERLRGALRPPLSGPTDAPADDTAVEAIAALADQVETARERFHAAMEDNFNTAEALGHVFNLVRAINAARAAGVRGEPFAQAQAAFRELTHVLGLELRAVAGHQEEAEAAPFIQALIKALIEVREDLRREKQWAQADKIRDRLAELGVALEDRPEGAEWRWERSE
ncbi:MAG TPA: cysteine--tRNA ligase [Chloroflexi bacterium]|nr:cysteine--tRNA ligase [Chloroflexota bacterium]